MRRIALFLALACAASAQQLPSGLRSDIDPQLMQEIDAIPAIDHHSHMPKVVPEGGVADDEFDALPVPERVIINLPVGWRQGDNPLYLEADKYLYAYPYNDYSPEHKKRLDELKAAARKQHGDGYPAWVLDKVHTQILFANRIAMGQGLTNTNRFRWVPYDDALMYPLNNANYLKRSDVDAFSFDREDKLLQRYMQEAGVQQRPATLADYLSKVLTPTVEAQKKGGAVGVKFEMAYLRPLYSEKVAQADAERVYAKYANAVPPIGPEYTMLQDFLFRYICKEAGRLGMAVHFHTGAGGTYNFDQENASVLKLGSLFNDPDMAKTNFVMVHGGVPNVQDAAYMMSKKNVYADCSEMDQFYSPRMMAAVLRQWMEWYPEKIMFGSDLFPEPWEEQAYVAYRSAREGLAIALTGMMRDGEINRARASQLAHMFLHDNAAKLYGLP
jgi:uncharacterized protein